MEVTDVPLFVSRRTMPKRKVYRALGPWALDSGGFSELSMYGEWRTPIGQYISEVRRWHDEVGNMAWAAPQDWMCEAHIVAKTGLTVREHQYRTTVNYIDLRMRSDLPFIPVLQGWTFDDYKRHADQYERMNCNLIDEPIVGIGSVCRRQQLEGGREVIEHFARQGLRLHGFGMKTTGLEQVAYLLASSDSMAWSYAARRGDKLPTGCTHARCSNCLKFALAWREKVLRTIAVQQPSLFTTI